MLRYITLILFICLILFTAGCGKIKGPRFWWDDRSQEKLPEDYHLPPLSTSDQVIEDDTLPEREAKYLTEQDYFEEGLDKQYDYDPDKELEDRGIKF